MLTKCVLLNSLYLLEKNKSEESNDSCHRKFTLKVRFQHFFFKHVDLWPIFLFFFLAPFFISFFCSHQVNAFFQLAFQVNNFCSINALDFAQKFLYGNLFRFFIESFTCSKFRQKKQYTKKKNVCLSEDRKILR